MPLWRCCRLSPFRLIEQRWAALSKVRSHFGILKYWRYRDDIFIIARAGSNSAKFVDEIVSRAKSIYKVEIEATSAASEWTSFLNIELRVEAGIMQIRPFVKATTADTMPLSSSSAHTPHVHTSWPRSLSRTMGRCSSRRCYEIVAQQELVARFVRNHLTPPTLANLPRSTVAKAVVECTKRWLAIPYHASLPGFLKRALDELNNDEAYKHMWRTGYSDLKVVPPAIFVAAAWKNAGPHHCRRISGQNTVKAKALVDQEFVESLVPFMD